MDQSSPSALAFREMAEGNWNEDPDFLAPPPDETQITQVEKLRTGIEFLAENGYPQNAYCTVNDLDDGIWEFRLGKIRVSFFDTEGDGVYTPKLRIQKQEHADTADDFWWLPDFDSFIRLGHCFGKNSQQTEPADISETLRVREEDVAHDRNDKD